MKKKSIQLCLLQGWPPLLCLAGYVVALLGFPYLCKTLIFPGKNSVIVWPVASLTWSVSVLLIFMPVLSWYAWTNHVDKDFRFSHRYLAPLIFLMPSLVPLFFPAVFPLSLPSNIAVYVPIFLFSLVLYHWLRRSEKKIQRQPGRPAPLLWKPVLLMTLGMSLFFWLVGWYFSVNAGETLGDEGHYIIQAISLYQDHDLDLRNNFSPYDNWRLAKPGGRSELHISPYAKDGHLYSWHPFGISALMATLEGYGLGGRHLVLGIVAGLGCGAMLSSCLLLGSSLPISIVFTLLFSFSGFWAVYACRALPETAGGTLTAWLLTALILYRSRPVRSVLLGVLCCGLLPWFHTRFGPIAALGGIFFLSVIWSSDHGNKEKIRQSLLFCLIAMLAAALFFAVQFSMFKGGSPYPIKSTLFSYLPGMWYVVFGWRSITYMLPLFAWLTGTILWIIAHDRQWRAEAVIAVLLFVTVLATSCSFGGWSGGSSPYGRYLLVVSPLFLPFGAFVYNRLSRPAQWLGLFLGLVPCIFFFLMLANLDLMYRHFVDPRGNLAGIVPVFSGLSNPFSTVWFGPLFFLVCIVTVWWQSARPRDGLILAGLLVMMATAAHHPENIDRGKDIGPYARDYNAGIMERIDLKRAAVRTHLTVGPTYGLEDVFHNRLDFYHAQTIGQLTTRKRRVMAEGNIISQPLLPLNDWQQRQLRWATLVPPFQFGGPGEKMFCARGKITGTARVVLAVAELSSSKGRTALETTLSWPVGRVRCQCFSLSAEAFGQTFLLARIEKGEGELHLERIAWYPVNQAFLEKTRLRSPCINGLEGTELKKNTTVGEKSSDSR